MQQRFNSQKSRGFTRQLVSLNSCQGYWGYCQQQLWTPDIQFSPVTHASTEMIDDNGKWQNNLTFDGTIGNRQGIHIITLYQVCILSVSLMTCSMFVNYNNTCMLHTHQIFCGYRWLVNNSLVNSIIIVISHAMLRIPLQICYLHVQVYVCVYTLSISSHGAISEHSR